IDCLSERREESVSFTKVEENNRFLVASGPSERHRQGFCWASDRGGILKRSFFGSKGYRWLRHFPACGLFASVCLVLVAQRGPSAASTSEDSRLIQQTQAEADAKSAGCLSCHAGIDEATMHPTGTVRLGCTDCPGGNAGVSAPAGAALGSPEYEEHKTQAHPQPSHPEWADRAANPVRPYMKCRRG